MEKFECGEFLCEWLHQGHCSHLLIRNSRVEDPRSDVHVYFCHLLLTRTNPLFRRDVRRVHLGNVQILLIGMNQSHYHLKFFLQNLPPLTDSQCFLVLSVNHYLWVVYEILEVYYLLFSRIFPRPANTTHWKKIIKILSP